MRLAERQQATAEYYASLEDTLDRVWMLLYPGKTDWEYPGQVLNHIRVELEKLQNERRLLYSLLANAYTAAPPPAGSDLHRQIQTLLDAWNKRS